MSGLVHEITTKVPNGDLVRWECACGTWGNAEPHLAEQITADHLAADDTAGPMAVHAANLFEQARQVSALAWRLSAHAGEAPSDGQQASGRS